MTRVTQHVIPGTGERKNWPTHEWIYLFAGPGAIRSLATLQWLDTMRGTLPSAGEAA